MECGGQQPESYGLCSQETGLAWTHGRVSGKASCAEARAFLRSQNKEHCATSHHARQDIFVNSTVQAPASCPFTHWKYTGVFIQWSRCVKSYPGLDP